jgi:ADP-ribosylglycohydrolase
MPDLRSRARGCLIGLAVGDALGGPTEGATPKIIMERWGRVTGFLSAEQGGSDDTEYALFNARLILRCGPGLTADDVATAWLKEIAGERNAFSGAGFSEMMAIRNLRRGLRPPQSGRHAHSWSDGLAMRVAPFGIVAAGKPRDAARLAEVDGSVTHSGEGIHAGRAVAASVAAAMGGVGLADILDAGQNAVPGTSWTAASIARGRAIGDSSPDVWSALPSLYQACVTPSYFWSDIAPEALGLAYGILAASRGDFREAVLGGVNVGRDTDTIAAIIGAILGSMEGELAIPAEWRERVGRASGRCLNVVAGMDIAATADRLAAQPEGENDENE